MKSLSLNRPHMIIMIGTPGSGKTFFADKFASTFNAPFLQREAIAAILGKDTKEVGQLLAYQLTELLKTNQSILIETSADTRAERSELTQKARQAGYEPLIVWVQTDPQTAKGRFLKDKKNSETYERRLKRFSAPLHTEKPLVISGKHTYATQAKVLLKRLSEPRAEISAHATPPLRKAPELSRRRNITVR